MTTAQVIGLCPKQIQLVVRPFGAAAISDNNITLEDGDRRLKNHALATGHVRIDQASGGTARLVQVLAPLDSSAVRPGHAHLAGFGDCKPR